MDTASELDKDTQAFLNGIAASDAPAWEDLTIVEAREGLRTAMLACSASAPMTASEMDIIITGPGGDIPLIVYTPPGERQQLRPVVLLFHGGGWCLGDDGCYDNFARGICAGAESLVINVDYRLAPEHKFPAGLEDCYAALGWLQEHASELGGDPERIALLGDSSGANLVAAVCHLVAQIKGQQPATQILLNPFLDLRKDTSYTSRHSFGGGEYYISEASISWTIAHYLSDEIEAETIAASPALASEFDGQPKALILTSGFDPLRDEGADYARKLESAGVSVDYHCFETTIHGFLTFDGVITAGRAGNAIVTDWLKCNLQNPVRDKAS